MQVVVAGAMGAASGWVGLFGGTTISKFLQVSLEISAVSASELSAVVNIGVTGFGSVASGILTSSMGSCHH
jgi:hypothetical protein